MKIKTLNQLKKIADKVGPELVSKIARDFQSGDEIHVFKSLREAKKCKAVEELSLEWLVEIQTQVFDRGRWAVVNVSSIRRIQQRETLLNVCNPGISGGGGGIKWRH
ncbi:MAG: hypothetical protein WC575_03410 [Patescibacteria group bacterium]